MSIKKTIVSIDQKFNAVMALVEKTKTKQQVMLELRIKPNTLNDWFRNKERLFSNTIHPIETSQAKKSKNRSIHCWTSHCSNGFRICVHTRKK